MKGLVNSEGKLVKLVNGKAETATEFDATTFPDQVTKKEQIVELFKKGGVDADLTGLELRALDVEIEKPRYKYSVAKEQPQPSLGTDPVKQEAPAAAENGEHVAGMAFEGHAPEVTVKPTEPQAGG